MAEEGELTPMQDNPHEFDEAANLICNWLAARAKDFGIIIENLNIKTDDPIKMLRAAELLKKEMRVN